MPLFEWEHELKSETHHAQSKWRECRKNTLNALALAFPFYFVFVLFGDGGLFILSLFIFNFKLFHFSRFTFSQARRRKLLVDVPRSWGVLVVFVRFFLSLHSLFQSLHWKSCVVIVWPVACQWVFVPNCENFRVSIYSLEKPVVMGFDIRRRSWHDCCCCRCEYRWYFSL